MGIKRRKEKKGREKGAGKGKGKEKGKRKGKKTRAGPDQTQAGEAENEEEKRRAVRREAICADAKQRRNARACTHETVTGEDKPIDGKNETWKRRRKGKKECEERKDGGRYVIADAQVSE